jgi:hypothetical protein
VRGAPLIAARDSGVPGRFRFCDCLVTVENLGAPAGNRLVATLLQDESGGARGGALRRAALGLHVSAKFSYRISPGGRDVYHPEPAAAAVPRTDKMCQELS